MDNFQNTVNLKDKMEKERQRMLRPEPENNNRVKPAAKPAKKSRAEGIDEVYKTPEAAGADNNLRAISRPAARIVNEKLYKNIIFLLAAILIAASVYFIFFNKPDADKPAANTQSSNWYAVKLDNDEIYYGQIDNTSANPVVIKNVYYDYDLLNKTGKDTGATGSLRLVKKGKETYGPSGTMEVYHEKILSLDLLKEDSKVLKAILDYENKGK